MNWIIDRVSGAVTILIALGLFFGAYTLYDRVFSADRDEAGDIVAAGALSVFDLQVGDCFNSPDVDGITTVAAVPCSDPHEQETYAVFDIDLPEFPGDDTISLMAEEACISRFEPFVGIPYADSILAVTMLYPSVESWNEAQDREVVCVLFHLDGELLTGSASESGI